MDQPRGSGVSELVDINSQLLEQNYRIKNITKVA